MGSKNQNALSPRLVVIEGKEKGKVIPLSDGTAVIGRSKGDVLIQDPRISRSHVAIHFDSRTSKLSYTDLKSLNGTLVNGENVESGELHDGDKLQIGNTLFDIQLSSTEDETSEASLRMKAAKKLKTESSLEERKPEPQVEIALAPPEEEAAEPAEMGEAPAAKGARTLLSMPSLKISRRTRNITASILAIGAGLWYLGGTGGSVEGLERSTSSISKLTVDGKYEEALAKAEEMRKQYPDSSHTYMTLGNLYMATNKNDLAIGAFERAHGLKPDQELVHIKLIRVYLRGQKPERAGEELQHLERLIMSGNHSKDLFVEAAYLFMEFKELKQPPEKTLILSKALQKEYAPGSAIGYKLEAQLHLQENRAQDALLAMEKGRQLDPNDEWLLENMMFTKLALKDQSGAEVLLEEWTKLKPAATKPLLVLGYLRYNEKNYAKSLPFVQKVLQIAAGNPEDPQYPEGLDLMGKIYVALNQPAEATNFLKQACEAGFTQSCENPLVKAAGGAAPIPQYPPPKTANPGGELATPPPSDKRAPGSATAEPEAKAPPGIVEPGTSEREAEAPETEIPDTGSSGGEE